MNFKANAVNGKLVFKSLKATFISVNFLIV